MDLKPADTNARPISLEARGSMDRYGIPSSPQNFEVWFTYHSGTRPDLNRAIDILLSNHREFTDEINEEIFEFFFGSAREHQVIRETTVRVSSALDALISFVNQASSNASSSLKSLEGLSEQVVAGKPLNELLGNLIRETKLIEEYSRLLQHRLVSSSAMIHHLREDFEDAKRDALTDGLTQIPNRKSFDSTLRHAAMEVMETGVDLSLLLIDVDHFKSFNDTWGHQTGDDVLRALAQSLAAKLRDGDTPARYGGEEFAAILPDASLDEALRIGDLIRRAVASETFRDEKRASNVGPVTVSVGAALFEPGETLVSLISRADSALYDAKRQGRNVVVAAKPCAA